MFFVLSLFALYVFLIGYAAGAFARAAGGPLEKLALAFGTGVLINYCLVLSGQPLTRVWVAGLVLAACGAARFIRDLLSWRPRQHGANRTLAFSIACILYLLGTYYFLILSEPLFRWDARSVWFFKARMIWAAGGLNEHAGWTHPSVGFSTPHYPNLVPAIAAQLVYLKGYWNEFFPKGSLLIILLPLLLWVFSFSKSRVSFVLLVLASFLSLGAWLSNGYMDGYLALYGGVALLSFGRYLADGREVDLYSGICTLGIVASLKNEGVLFGFCAILSLLIVSSVAGAVGTRSFVNRLRTDRLLVIVVLISVAPTLIWTIYRQAWDLQSAITAEPLNGLSRLGSRLTDGHSPLYVMSFLTVRATAFWMLIGLVAAVAAFANVRGVKLHRGGVVAVTTAGLYVGGLALVYLSTPADLFFHLSTSATRTVTTASMAMVVGLFFLLSGFEKEAAR